VGVKVARVMTTSLRNLVTGGGENPAAGPGKGRFWRKKEGEGILHTQQTPTAEENNRIERGRGGRQNQNLGNTTPCSLQRWKVLVSEALVDTDYKKIRTSLFVPLRGTGGIG